MQMNMRYPFFFNYYCCCYCWYPILTYNINYISWLWLKSLYTWEKNGAVECGTRGMPFRKAWFWTTGNQEGAETDVIYSLTWISQSTKVSRRGRRLLRNYSLSHLMPRGRVGASIFARFTPDGIVILCFFFFCWYFIKINLVIIK